jgi:NOL1/NOP2/sun family putative RNA methylase
LKTLLPSSNEKSRELARKYGYDEWLVSRFLCYVPGVDDFLAKMELPPAQYIRVNTLKTSVDDVLTRLLDKGFVLEKTLLPEVFSVKVAPMSAGATTEYLLGLYYVQDLSSCISVDALEVEAGQEVLDIAAAPGGKTTMIAQKMNNTGSIVALEPSAARARSMSFNLARCGVSNTCVVRNEGQQVSNFKKKFDRVLLDAPCSCEGVIAKDVSRKTSHEPADVEFCSNKQESLIEAAAGAVKSGGILVYSTCSFAPEENESVVSSLLQKRDDVSVEDIEVGTPGLTQFQDLKFDSAVENTRRLYPHLHDTTGFYVAKLRFD